jgi:hypothetical protein
MSRVVIGGSEAVNGAQVMESLEIWTSDVLGLRVLTMTTRPGMLEKTAQYKSIRLGANPSPSLFTIPAEYKIVTGGGAVATPEVQ